MSGYRLDVLSADSDAVDWTVLHTDTHDTIAGITALSRQHLIDRAGPAMVTIVITAPDGRLYPFAQGAGGFQFDSDATARRADDMIYHIQALLHWHADRLTATGSTSAG